MLEKISVLLPTYNNEKTIKQTIDSVLNQIYADFEIIVVDDCSTDRTVKVIESMSDNRIKIYQNSVNLGCGNNLTKCVSMANNDIVYFLCGDDVLVNNATLFKIVQMFLDDKISIISRIYYWFDADPYTPIRRKKEYIAPISVIDSLDQISGIAMRKSKILNDFSSEPFMEMLSVAYPMIKDISKVGYLKSDSLAIRVHPMSSNVFVKSPIKKWYDMLKDSPYLINNYVARNYVGLVQIKNYGTYKQLLREIGYLIKYRPMNLLSIKFWFFTLGTLIVPKIILKTLVNLYRRIPK